MNSKPDIPDPESWVDLYGDYLYAFALSRLNDRARAEDAVQDTFLAAWKKLDSFDGRVDLKFWLRGIMRNKIVDTIRKSLREIPVEKFHDHELRDSKLMQFAGIPTRSVDDWNFNPSKQYEEKEFWETFQGCLSKVKEPLRSVYILKEIEHESSENICKEFSISPNNLWVMLHRARKSLKTCLNKNWGGKLEK